MKTLLLTMLAFIASALPTQAISNREVEAIERKLEPVRELVATLATRISSKYQLKPIGVTLGTPEGVVEILGLEFQKRSRMPLRADEARKLIVAISEEIIAEANHDKDVLALAKNSPFNVRNIELSIFMQDENRYNRHHPDLSVVSLYNGTISYKTTSPDPKWILKTVSSHRETYEEAKAILEGEKDHSPCAS